MDNKILPDAINLMSMTDDELREELCKDIYNRANSHEMIRRLVKVAKDYAKAALHFEGKVIDLRDAIDAILGDTDDEI